MSARFRRAVHADVPAVLGLMTGLYDEDGLAVLDAASAELALRELMGRPDLGEAWVAEADEAVIGYLVLTWGFSLEYHGRDAFVDELYVAPSHRGRGIGRRALEVAEATCRTQGVRALHLEVEHTNGRAETLYRRVGFADHGRRLMTRPLL